MSRILTKLSLAAVAAVALLALGIILLNASPASAQKPPSSKGPSYLLRLVCDATNPFAKWDAANSVWVCDPGTAGAKGDKGDTGPSGADTLGGLGCTTDQIARWNSVATQWECSDDGVANLQAQIDDLLLFALGFFRFVFISSRTFDGDLGGIDGADAECNSMAKAAALPGTFKAWLAGGSSISPDTRFTKVPGRPYVLVNGDIVATDWSALTNAFNVPLSHPINIDENGIDVGIQPVWTNVAWTGQTNIINFFRACGDWRGTNDFVSGQTGLSSMTDEHWTEDAADVSCAVADRRLYCFGQ